MWNAQQATGCAETPPFQEPEWIQYDRWNAFIPEGNPNAAIGYEEFVSKILPEFGGPMRFTCLFTRQLRSGRTVVVLISSTQLCITIP